MTPIRARYAAEVFLAAMRREWLQAHAADGKECPVKRFEDYDGVSQRALTRSLAAAVHSASTEADTKFERFRTRLEAERNDA